MAAVASMSLPPLRLIRRIGEGYVGSPSLPQLLLEAFASGLVLQARIVDFWSGSRAIRLSIRLWLEILGFSVLVADDCVQIGASCGYVAARATGIMFAAGNNWRSVDVSDAAEETWIVLGNALLENGWATADFLEQQEVYILAQLFHEHVFSLPHQPWDSHSQAFPSMSWPLRIGPLDWVARGIGEALMAYVRRGRVDGDPERAFFVTNTTWSGHSGSHWISVAISMHYD